MLAGLIRDDERKVREGMPGLSDIPGVGQLFGHTREREKPDRRHPDADAAHRPRSGAHRRRPARFPDGPGFGSDRRPAGKPDGTPAGGVGLPVPPDESRIAPIRSPMPSGLSNPAACLNRPSQCCRRRRHARRRPTLGKRYPRTRNAAGSPSSRGACLRSREQHRHP